MNTALLTGYILAVTALLITPGPVMALVTATAARSGYLSAFRTILGTHLASLILIFLAVLMLAGIVSLDPSLLSALGIAGACYLGFKGISRLIRVLEKNEFIRIVKEGQTVLTIGADSSFSVP